MAISVSTRILSGTTFDKIGTKKNLSALHSLTVLSRVRGAAPSWRGADVVRPQPSSVAFVRTVCCGIEKDMIKHNFFDISIRADGIPPNATT